MLHLHRCDRAELLVGGLAGLLRTPPADPFTPEVIAVPSRGVERWLAQTLASVLGATAGRGDGVCANVEFPTPSRLVREVSAPCCGIDPAADPWQEQRLVWPLLAAVDACREEPWCAVLGRHLAGERGEARRLAVAQKLARLFTSYGAQRPQLIRDWAAGGEGDGAGGSLADDLRWQPPLWRDLRERVGLASPAERLDTVRAELRRDPRIVALPERLSVFGATRLAADEVAVLAALAVHREVHLWLPHPSPALWERVAAGGAGVSRRRADPTAVSARHPLLASLGRDARELHLSLAAAAADTDVALTAEAPGGTFLAAFQAAVRADLAPDGGYPLGGADRSIGIHACHGAARQVEVLREIVVGALAEDPTLEPRDILVMCPDIDTFAPLISAAFGAPGEDRPDRHPGQSLRIKLADRSLRRTNPVLSVLGRLLDLADARLTASEVLDLAAMPAVRLRFGFADDDLARLRGWVRESGIRWGLDAAARAPYGLASVDAHTWQRGLDRLLLGVAMDTGGLPLIGDTLPVDDVASSDVALVGTFAEFIDRLARTTAVLSGTRSATAWRDALARAVDDFAAAAADESWQVEGAHDQVAAAFDGAGAAELTLAGVRSLLEDRLRGRPTRANFRTGDLTFATMVPMRSVPHRVICVLGLDDGAFPRHRHTDGDDVLARDPLTGERDPSGEDRQLLLDALLAARDRLVLLYTGADPRTGAIRPPAVPLSEVLDALEATGRCADGRPVRDQIVVHHVLQPFDPRNFAAASPFSFDRAAAAGARALQAPRVEPSPAAFDTTLGATLDTTVVIPEAVSLDDLVAFCEHPVRAYVRHRLGLAPDEEDSWSDDLPIETDPLGRWAVGDWALQQRLLGVPPERVLAAAWYRPELPLGGGAVAVLTEVAAGVDAVMSAAAPVLAAAGAARAVSVSVPLACGTRLTGTVPGVRGDTVLRAIYSRLGPKHRLRAWVYLLALCAAAPAPAAPAPGGAAAPVPQEQPWRSVVIARSESKRDGGAQLLTVPAVAPEAARRALDGLVRLYAEGLARPLPLPLKASYSYAEQRLAGREKVGLSYAGQEWRKEAGGRVFGEFEDAYHRYVWGRDAPFSTLLAERYDGDPPHRFGQLALWLWSPILRVTR